MRWRAIALLVPLSGNAAFAQVIAGRVLDRTDSLVVSGAQIHLDGRGRIRSDGHGQFRLAEISPGRHEISIRMLGYTAFADSVDLAEGRTMTADIFLTRVPRLLSQMVVKGRSLRVPTGFEDVYRRAASSTGSFLTREQIDSLNPRDVAGLLHEVPFVHVNPNTEAPIRVETSRCRNMLPGQNVSGQLVAIYFNGVPMTDATSLNEVLSHLAPSSIQAVEVYNGPTSVPQIFQPACGAIAIWTRKG